ncbi:MAG: CAP domain-containing protein [Nitrospirae bacterium]|nr:CAP domain-containing protein [Nitrospirota bacterium]MCL5977698.1 CAP domain-containing protein [Nitrospirota bacterium]
MRILLVVIVLSASFLQGGLCDDAVPSSYEEKLLIIINSYRTQSGLSPLKFDAELSEIAKGHCGYMHSRNMFNHDNFDERFGRADRQLCVENLGWNAATPEEQFRLWKESGTHNANMLNDKIRFAGIAKTGPYVTFFACR